MVVFLFSINFWKILSSLLFLFTYLLLTAIISVFVIDGYHFCVENNFLFQALTAAICRLILKINRLNFNLLSATLTLAVFALWNKVDQEVAQKHDYLIHEELYPGAYSLKFEVGVDVVVVASAYSREANKHDCINETKFSN